MQKEVGLLIANFRERAGFRTGGRARSEADPKRRVAAGSREGFDHSNRAQLAQTSGGGPHVVGRVGLEITQEVAGEGHRVGGETRALGDLCRSAKIFVLTDFQTGQPTLV